MKVLIFESWHEAPQLETSLELAEEYAENGHEVYYVHIGGILPYVEWYNGISKGISKFLYRKSVQHKIKLARKLINSQIQVATDSMLSGEEIESLYEELTFKNLEELKAYVWQGIDVGLAAASSHISVTNDLYPDTLVQNEVINRIIHSSKIVATSFQKWLDKIAPDLVLFRNGRVATYRPILRICQREKQQFLVHDRACDKFHYSLGPTYRHDWEMRKDELEENWEKSVLPLSTKQKIGRDFFEERKVRKNDSFTVFAKDQKVGMLPSSWNKDNFNVVYFNSSISEYAAVGDEVNPHVLFDSQEDSLVEIARHLSNRPNTKLYLRLHPNLINQSRQEKELWYNLESEQINVIKPDSPIDTYALIEQADLVICYLSTVGVEAAYCGTPTISLSHSLYSRLDVVYQPATKEELFELLDAENLPAKPNERCLEYGFYMKTHGIKHKYFHALTHQSGRYKGVDLQKLDFKQTKRKLISPLEEIYRKFIKMNKN
ncbi:DUF354 domain-containing protein [Algoriphagus formosus]|uniref:DUF354 domain-containing protein n=1 Tax=Algoriphagus formosus TaxID=2007308 RepID=A0A4V3ARN6_9BACT|nr:DUF354 domain-containing protein [Algoriphagus aquimaris]TDK47317.1 DUF354 domain-containing protein [Algoriphagus aquimaris]